MLKQKNKKILFFWEGVPACGLLLKRVTEEFGENITVVATRAAVPFEDLETLLGHEIIWFENPNDIWERRKEFFDYDFVFHTGWGHKGWIKFDKFLKKKKPEVRIIVTVDNFFRKDLRQIIGSLYFRLFLKKIFDAAFVTGVVSKRLMIFLGMPESRIYIGHYGAYEGVYKNTTPIQNRKNNFLFVGQLIHRKGVDILEKAFTSYKQQGGGWGLCVLGEGGLQTICSKSDVVCEGFTQPYAVSEKMNQAKVLLFPSRYDHWGTVVCEAAACGMHIVSTKFAGSSYDIIENKENGLILDKVEIEDLVKAMFYYENLSKKSLIFGSEISENKAKNFNSENYLKVFREILNDLS